MSDQEDKPIDVAISEVPHVPDNQQVDFFNVVSTMIQTTTSVPTNVPKKVVEQILIVNNSGFKLYIYDTVGNAWKYTALT